MKRFAPVVPIEIAALLKEARVLGNYHLLLAHDVLRRPEEYRGMYGDLIGMQGTVIIMDNSVVELGKPVSIEELGATYDILRSDLLVMPDMMGDLVGTIDLAKEFYRQYETMQEVRNRRHIPPLPHLMGVVQGTTMTEVLHCLDTYRRMAEVAAIAIPRIAVEYIGSRVPIAHALAVICPEKPVHLLGFSDDILDDIGATRMPNVMGIDSAVPVRAGLRGMAMSVQPGECDPGPRGDYWEVGARGITPQRLVQVVRNIGVVRELIDAYKPGFAK